MPQRDTEKAFDLSLVARGHHVDRPTQLIHFSYTEDPDYPVHALVKHKFSNITSVYRCKYLIGSDGASSLTRRLLGIPSESSDPDDFWVVADMELETSFPDQRRRSHIRTPAGTMMMIPCAGGVNRIYTRLTPEEIADLGGVDKAHLAHSGSILTGTEWEDTKLLEILKTRVKEVLRPYTGEIKRLQWISQYRIKQRIISKFYDGSRVFVMGDACHTHSPKAAQGLNVSMMDAYNLTWKLALVLQGKLQQQILETYNTERLQIAQELIDFDRKISHVYIKQLSDNNSEITKEYHKAHGFTAGVGLQYKQSGLVKHHVEIEINPESLEPLIPGKRLLPPTLIRHIDGSKVSILDDMPSNGRFHLFIFAGNALSQARLAPCAAYLNSSSSILTRYSSFAGGGEKVKEWGFEDIRHTNTRNNGRTVDLFLIHSDNYYEYNVADLPAPFPDWKYRVYADEGQKEHLDHGVDPNTGAMALIRPDGYIGLVTSLDGGPAITEFMDRFMIVAKGPVDTNGYANGHVSGHDVSGHDTGHDGAN